MRRVELFDHLDTGAAVLSNLIDVGTLHQAQAALRMPQAVGCTRSAFAVEATILLSATAIRPGSRHSRYTAFKVGASLDRPAELFEVLLVVGVQISIYRHPVLRVLLEKDEEFWKVVIRLGDSRVDALHHLSFRLNRQSRWGVDLKDGSQRV